MAAESDQARSRLKDVEVEDLLRKLRLNEAEKDEVVLPREDKEML